MIEDLRDLANRCTKFFLNHTVDLFEELDIRGEAADLEGGIHTVK